MAEKMTFEQSLGRIDEIVGALEKGDALRVDVSSANRQFAPHPNVAGLWCAVRETKVAHNTVVFGDSALMLKYDLN